MEEQIKKIQENQDVRDQLIELRKEIKDEKKWVRLLDIWPEHEQVLTSLLKDEDAKIRKNAALLLGELECQSSAEQLFEAYQNEGTRFIRSAYLTALNQLEVRDKLDAFKQRQKELYEETLQEDSLKHVEEELRELQKIIIHYEGIEHHTFDAKDKSVDLLLLCNRLHRETVCKTIEGGQASVHPLGVQVKTDRFALVASNRLYRELLFPVHMKGTQLLDWNPRTAAEQLAQSDLYPLLCKLHKEGGIFSFRVECKSPMALDEKSDFVKKFSSAIERLYEGNLINSVSDYEIEIRLIQMKNGFFPCVKLYTYKDRRFTYRKQTIAASIHPSTAALLMELSKDYLKEGAQVMDPFCGVGTMLIERDLCVQANEMYATDTFGEAIQKGRINAKAAGEWINFIHRDFFDFRHKYLFDEIVTDMPVRGAKTTKEEMDRLYERFFEKIGEILKEQAVIVLYTNEMGFVKKQLRLHKKYCLLKEIKMQDKGDFYLIVIGTAR